MNKFLGKARRIRARLARGLEMAAARTKIVRYINARTPGHCDEESPAALPTSGGLESMTIQSVVFCGGNHPVIFVPGRANLLSHHTLARPACCSVWCDATDRFSPLKQPNNSLQHPLRWKTQSVGSREMPKAFAELGAPRS